jgi:hypothetical protein
MGICEPYQPLARPFRPFVRLLLAIGDAARLAASSLGELGAALSRLPAGQRAYITAEGYERLTGEELDEFSIEGRKMIGELAAAHGCTIEMSSPIERRVYFTKSS